MSELLGSLPNRLAKDSYITDETSHIEVNQDAARRTGAADLLIRVCPAGVYSKAANGDVDVEHAACLECGTCLAVAPEGVLTWHYPAGGFGIVYREG